MDEEFDLIPDEAYEDLPHDPRKAFLKLNTLARSNLLHRLEGVREWDDRADLQLDYMNTIVALANEFGIDGIKDLTVPRAGQHNGNLYGDFMRDVSFYVTQMKIAAARSRDAESVKLSPEDKKEMFRLVSRLRSLVEASNLPAGRKETLLKRLHEFELDLNKKRIPFAMIGMVAMTIFNVCHEAGDGLKGLKEGAEAVLWLAGKAVEVEQSLIQLPSSGDQPKALAAPKRPPPDAAGSFPLDEEIPF